MNSKGRSSLLLFGLAVLLLAGARAARACSCAASLTVLDAYEQADVVVVAEVLSVEKAGESSEGAGYGVVVSARLAVEKVFKGGLKPGEELIFGPGGGGSCRWTFSDESIGRKYLFYVPRPDEDDRLWSASICGRSTDLSSAGDDLLFLNNLDKALGRTRVSGTVDFHRGAPPSVEGLKVRLSGAGKTYELRTDKQGVYEIYDLPAGVYTVEPEVPAGWKVDEFFLEYAPSIITDERAGPAAGGIRIAVREKRHAGLDIYFEIDNAVSGKVYDATGKPLKGVCVDAVPTAAQKEAPRYFDCTDEGGGFAIAELSPGNYILVANNEGKVSSSEPFQTFYYPNVSERERAAVFTIAAGDKLHNFNLYAPKMEETVTVEGVFLYSDGKPVVEESVVFKAELTRPGVEGDASARTDAGGRFSIKILKGLTGKLHGEMYAYVGEFEKCPALEAAIKETGHTGAMFPTPAVGLRADNSLDGLVLKYPFPGCKKAKESERE